MWSAYTMLFDDAENIPRLLCSVSTNLMGISSKFQRPMGLHTNSGILGIMHGQIGGE